ncbi:MAG: hypothetical protein VYA09_02620 [Candidatus Neomarinimicrobiota bacterium]|nr:hypothetical protein [Candidatus Neomarinimicrobiota bacterium]MEC9273807.1 hypothetical protein [Candidatus Neomarinimicrobiota bacterium]|tara:strand:- start:726 stop:992 length:267 start_codon:yes stop_codon:yes gene_type:complete
MANKSEKLISLFEDLAEKLSIKLLQDKGDFTGGSCLVKDENFIVVNKRKPVEQRLKILAQEFSKKDLSDIYIIPALREFIEKSQSKSK